jgi:hypothetical protein
MSEFSNLINTFASHVTAANVETFILFVERLITLGGSVAAGATNPVVATVDVLSDVASAIAPAVVVPTPPSASVS